MNRCLVTGCDGFVGAYLASLLLEKGQTVYGTVHQHAEKLDNLQDRITILKCDISDRKRVEDVVSEVKPDCVFHLAAQSLIRPSWQDPEKTIETNILGTLYLLDSVRKANIDPLIEVACSSAEYGFTGEGKILIKEDEQFKPSSPYGVSKVGQDVLAYLYWRTYSIKVIRVRPFYITGPGKISDACSDFARGIVEVEKGQIDTLNTGKLESVRDIVDVRDCVKAMWLLMEHGVPGEAYNICSGRGYKMRDILDMLLSMSPKKINVTQSPEKMRPSDDSILIGDNSKLCRLGWKPQIPIERTLSDILDYWKKRLA
jgi:GDP-4-dehydro-6-deoxy-D-mannose reductase